MKRLSFNLPCDAILLSSLLEVDEDLISLLFAEPLEGDHFMVLAMVLQDAGRAHESLMASKSHCRCFNFRPISRINATCLSMLLGTNLKVWAHSHKSGAQASGKATATEPWPSARTGPSVDQPQSEHTPALRIVFAAFRCAPDITEIVTNILISGRHVIAEMGAS